jgi:hypothetical protein
MILDYRNLDQSVKLMRGNMVYIQDLGTGKLRLINKDEAGKVCGAINSTARLLNDSKEKETVVDLYVKWESAHKLATGKLNKSFESTKRAILKRFNQTPTQYLEGFDERFKEIADRNEQALQAKIRTDLEYGIQIEAAKKVANAAQAELYKIAREYVRVRAEAVKKADEAKARASAQLNAEALAMQINAVKPTGDSKKDRY